jgi:hypothetical protein
MREDGLVEGFTLLSYSRFVYGGLFAPPGVGHGELNA